MFAGRALAPGDRRLRVGLPEVAKPAPRSSGVSGTGVEPRPDQWRRQLVGTGDSGTPRGRPSQLGAGSA
ncbi:hypothetical protein GCM10010440_36660 [Kitasatospora cinereorecta]